MTRVHRIDLRCRIDRENESIRGEMTDRQGNSLSFDGWTEFATALVSLARDPAGEAEFGGGVGADAGLPKEPPNDFPGDPRK
jgi:hypothetical protein